MTAEEVVKGARAWAAPEVLLGATFTASADIFSFGVVLWEIVTGRQPHIGPLRDARCALSPDTLS